MLDIERFAICSPANVHSDGMLHTGNVSNGHIGKEKPDDRWSNDGIGRVGPSGRKKPRGPTGAACSPRGKKERWLVGQVWLGSAMGTCDLFHK